MQTHPAVFVGGENENEMRERGIWKFVRRCVINIATYLSETWGLVIRRKFQTWRRCKTFI